MSEKKRKRNDDRAERPSKKAAVASSPGHIRVEHVENKSILGPILAFTPGLKCPSKISFKPYKSNTRILPEGESAGELLLQSSGHPRLDYTAQEEKDGSSDSILKNYVGVFDPATGKLQLVEVPKVTVRSTLRSELDEMRAEKEKLDAAKASMTEKRHALASEFGSRKSKKAIASMMENAISQGRGKDPNAATKDETVSSAVLQNISGAAVMPTKAELEAAVDSSKPRPQANLAAEFPADVYSIDTIVGKDLMGVIPIKDWVDAAEAGEGVSVTSRYVAKRINRLAKDKEIQKLKVLRFILLCINFNAALLKKGKGPAQVPPREKLTNLMGENIPEPVVASIRRRFATEKYDMPRWNIDNLMTHIAAAALIIDNFTVDVNDLRDDLKLENKDIKQYFHEIGCKIAAPTEGERTNLKISKAEAVNHFQAKLKLPLNFPRVKAGPRRRK